MILQNLLALVIALILGAIAEPRKTINNIPLEHTTSIEKLLSIENDLIENLNIYADKLAEKIDIMEYAVTKMRAENDKSKADPESYLSNPLNSFSLIRRMHADWLKWQEYMKQPVANEIIDSIGKLREKYPTEKHFSEATKAIYQIQRTYALTADELAAGIINGKQYDFNLTTPDCFAMGEYLGGLSQHSASLEWFEAAIKRFEKPMEKYYDILGVGLADIWRKIASKYIGLRNNEQSLKSIKIALSYRPNDARLKQFKRDLYENILHDRLCRGKYKKNTSKGLHCKYLSETSPYLKIGPIKLEIMSLNPEMFVYHDVVYDSEIKEMIEKSKPLLKRAKVGKLENKNAAGINSRERTAKLYFWPQNNNTAVDRLDQRVADMTGLSLENSELVCLINYGIAGHHYSHVDYYLLNDTDIIKGNRHTFILFYLNDVVEGGATVFSNMNLAIPAVKGTAVLFNILDNACKGDDRGLHASCPIIMGTKWLALKSLVQTPQMFRKPCRKI